MKYEDVRSVVQMHMNRAVRVVMDAEVDLDRPSEFRTEHILILMEMTKQNICDDLFNMLRCEECGNPDKIKVEVTE